MSAEQDIIQIILDVKDDEAKEAKATLDKLNASAKSLGQQLASATISNDQYRAGMKNLAGDAEAARAKLSALKDEMRDLSRQAGGSGPRLEGADRAGTKARLGLAAVNIAQDAIQGGPASAINNILALAGDGKIKSLLSEFVEGAGGVAGLASKATLAAAAVGTLFAAIDQGLKSAKLDWSDFDDVVGDLGPFKAAREAFDGLAVVARDWHLDAAWEGASEAASGYVNAIADATVGWNAATEAARAHKEEVQRGAKAALDYAAAAKSLGSVRSDDQQEAERRGKLVGQELANLGGASGIGAVIDKLARDATRHGADDKVPAAELDDKGKPTGKMVDITRRESARRRLTTDAAAAAAGDSAALDRLRPYLKSSGYDLGGLNSAAKGIDSDKAGKAADREHAQLMQDRIREAERHVEDVSRDYQRRAVELAKPLQDGFNLSGARGVATTEGQIRGRLEDSGVSKDEAKRMARAVLDQLTEGFADVVRERAGRLGTDAQGAKDSLVNDAQVRAERDRDEARRALGLDRKPDRPQVFHSYSEISDAIASAGTRDDGPDRSIAVQQEMRDKLGRAVDVLQQIANSREVARCGGARWS
jgi:hypothetical protein